MKPTSAKKKRRRLLMRRKRTLDPSLEIDYKNADSLKRFITDRGKIIPRRISGATASQQRKITTAVKRARFLALIPLSVAHKQERGFSGEMTAVAQAFSTSGYKRRDSRPGDRDRRPDNRADKAPAQENTED